MLLRKILLSICIPILLAACNGERTEETIHKHLEEAVQLEADFESQQSEITQLEVEEQQIYSQIIELGMEDLDQIIELSEQAIGIIDERQALMEVEKESIEKSKEEFNKIEELIPKLNDETKEKAEELYEVMDNRYAAYDSLNEAYTVSLELEKELYNMLQREDLEQEELTNHINTINDSYQKVLEANEQFNTFTVEYNELKKDFYEVAGIEVSYEEK